jgi:hypothetical protein
MMLGPLRNFEDVIEYLLFYCFLILYGMETSCVDWSAVNAPQASVDDPCLFYWNLAYADLLWEENTVCSLLSLVQALVIKRA